MQTATDKSKSGKDSGKGSVHRFHDKIAVTLPGGETVYLTTTEASALARALQGAALDVVMHSFTESHFAAREI